MAGFKTLFATILIGITTFIIVFNKIYSSYSYPTQVVSLETPALCPLHQPQYSQQMHLQTPLHITTLTHMLGMIMMQATIHLSKGRRTGMEKNGHRH